MYTSGKFFFLSLMACAMGVGQNCRAQSPSSFEVLELKTTLEAAARRNNELESQVQTQKAQAAALTQNLASANSQSMQARESYEKLRGVLEGLGIGALEGGADQVRERLLAALSDMKVLGEQRSRITEALLGLSEAALNYAKATPTADLEAGKKLETALASSEKVLRTAAGTAASETPAADLHDLKIVSLKPELALGVLNAGSRDGVRVGMPFAVVREDRQIAKAIVVEVRKSVAGFILQDVVSSAAPIRVGDRGVIEAEQSF